MNALGLSLLLLLAGAAGEYLRADPRKVCDVDVGDQADDPCVSKLRAELLSSNGRISPRRFPECFCNLLFNFRFNSSGVLATLLRGEEVCATEKGVLDVVSELEQGVRMYGGDCHFHTATYTETYSKDDITLFAVCGFSGLISIICLVLACLTFWRLHTAHQQQKHGKLVPVVQ